MNWDQMEGNWKQFKGKVRERWGSLTDSDLEMIQGKREQLIGKIQERYGIAKEEAERQVQEFQRASEAMPRGEKKSAESGRPHDQRRTGTGG